MEIPGGGGKSRQAHWNGKSWGVGAQTGKNPRVGGMDIFWNHTIHQYLKSETNFSVLNPES